MLTINFEYFRLEDGDRLLDLGCGEGRHAITAYMLKNARVTGVDLKLEDLKTAAQKFGDDFQERGNRNKSLVFIKADALSLPFPDNCFDKIICSEVLEHIPDYIGALREIERILKPGGDLAVSVPRFFPEWVCWRLCREYHQEEGGHVRIFRGDKLRLDIEERGMLYRGRHWAHALHVPYWWMQCLLWKNREKSSIIKGYRRFLIWEMFRKPRLFHVIDKVMNPFIGKSLVMYFTKKNYSERIEEKS